MSRYLMIDFINKILEVFAAELSENYKPEQGRYDGWLEAQDLIFADTPVDRRSAARISHEFIKRMLGEADEDKWQRAGELRDLYDCHSCVNHIAQVYVKGIMTAAEPGIFGNKNILNAEEAGEIIMRMKYPDMRVNLLRGPEYSSKAYSEDSEKTHMPKAEISGQEAPKSGASEETAARAIKLTDIKEVRKILEANPSAILIDVRSRGEYGEKHLDEAVNYPMAEIVNCFENTSGTDSNKLWEIQKDAIILLYCEKGYQSEIAANCLTEAGYGNVYFFGL